ncbi:hypothetical protein VN12_11645 [Pirellula sp. SH-Sr6A]|uniref:hypothetical protein n=1 Tax=Pirellula sp. SH-Sr6A TaxID=1632865 RepID=UPI00078B75AA|nr:hypothetical protein [Pirellula sp. SH-Sr6A]AMV32770.1 hypothetical protein VN12_11645 [Pirellula sp. SH-Sr6A]
MQNAETKKGDRLPPIPPLPHNVGKSITIDPICHRPSDPVEVYLTKRLASLVVDQVYQASGASHVHS